MRNRSIIAILVVVTLPIVIISVAGISFFAERQIENLATRLATNAARDFATTSLMAIEGPMLAGKDSETRNVFSRLAVKETTTTRIISARFPDLPLITYSTRAEETDPVISRRRLLDETMADRLVMEKMETIRKGDGHEAIVLENGIVSVLEAIPNQGACFHCHTDVGEGKSLGVTMVSQDIRPYLSTARKTAGILMAFIGTAEVGTVFLVGLLFWFLALRPLKLLMSFVDSVGSNESGTAKRLEPESFPGREIRLLADGLNTMVEALEEKDRFVRETIGEVASDILKIVGMLMTAFEQIRQGVSNQSSTTVRIDSAIDHINEAAGNVTDQADHCAGSMSRAEQSIQGGLGAANDMLDAMKITREAVEIAKQSSVEAGAMTKEIVRIVETIDGIADQTNILAINATIEAARAGELGRGFGIVAQEVRDLASHSANSAREIHEIVENAAEKMNDVNRQSDHITETINRTADLAQGVAGVIEELSAFLADIGQGIARTNDAAHGQANTIRETRGAIEAVEATNRETDTAVRHCGEIIEDLSRISDTLKRVLSDARDMERNS